MPSINVATYKFINSGLLLSFFNNTGNGKSSNENSNDSEIIGIMNKVRNNAAKWQSEGKEIPVYVNYQEK